MKRLATCCLLLLAMPLAALAELRITGDASVKPGKMARLKAEGMADGSVLFWDLDEDNLDVEESGPKLLLTGAPGVYKVRCRAVAQGKDGKLVGETARFTLTILGPPVPPAPVPPPTPPTPADPLAQSLQAAYALDADAGKADKVAFLAAVYRGAGPLADASKTNADLFARLKAAIQAPGIGLATGEIANTRKVANGFLADQFGANANTAVDATKAKAAFTKLSIALGGLK